MSIVHSHFVKLPHIPTRIRTMKKVSENDASHVIPLLWITAAGSEVPGSSDRRPDAAVTPMVMTLGRGE